MEREVGGGIGMGNTCKPLAVSFQCMTKSTTNKKKKKKKKIKTGKGSSHPQVVGVGKPLWLSGCFVWMKTAVNSYRFGKE